MSSAQILVVEDDAFKLDRISACLKRLNSTAYLTIVTSVQAAVAALADKFFDIVLLDMALPSHELRAGGGSASSMLSGGIEVIMELSYLRRREKVVVITQYPEVEIEGQLVPLNRVASTIMAMCDVNVAAVIHYKHEKSEWEGALIEAVQ